GRELRLGMYVNVAFGALGQSERTVPVVPAAAVQNISGRQVVFRETGDPSVFELRPVTLGSEVNGRFPVIEGIQVGDRVVTTGSFMLRAEWLMLEWVLRRARVSRVGRVAELAELAELNEFWQNCVLIREFCG